MRGRNPCSFVRRARLQSNDANFGTSVFDGGDREPHGQEGLNNIDVGPGMRPQPDRAERSSSSHEERNQQLIGEMLRDRSFAREIGADFVNHAVGDRFHAGAAFAKAI
jgi:hypothetical protein